jgi:hypothetical protein
LIARDVRLDGWSGLRTHIDRSHRKSGTLNGVGDKRQLLAFRIHGSDGMDGLGHDDPCLTASNYLSAVV